MQAAHTVAVPLIMTLTRAAVHVSILGCCAVFLWFVVDWLSPDFSLQWDMVYTWKGGLPVTYHNEEIPAGTALLDSYDISVVFLTWLPICTAAVLGLLLLHLPERPKPGPESAVKRSLLLFDWAKVKAKDVLAFQLWPSRFWVRWSGGMSVGDAMVALLLLGFNARYFTLYYKLYDKQLNAINAMGVRLDQPYSWLMLERMGLTFGIMLWPNIWLLFLPVPHMSFLTRWTGVPFSHMIRYHRWIGHITMWVLTMHGLLYYVYWLMEDSAWKAFDWSTESSINFLAGTIAAIFGWVLWLTSLSWFRRRFFSWFYKFHLIGFLGFTFFSYIHYYWAWSMFLPGLLIYAVDVALRAGQLGQRSYIVAADVAQGEALTTVKLCTAKDFAAVPGQEIFLYVAELSRWQWHPFTVHSHSRQPGGTGTLVLHVKNYAGWTKALVAAVSAGARLSVSVAGPFGEVHPARPWEACSSAVFIGGGIGAVPLLAALSDLVQRRMEHPLSTLRKVIFVWTARNCAEFTIMPQELLQAARDGTQWFELHLHCSGAIPGLYASKLRGKASSSDSGSADSTNNDAENPAPATQLHFVEGTDGAAGKPLSVGTIPAAVTHNTLDAPAQFRPLQPKLDGGLVEVLVTLLVFFGAFCGTVVVGGLVAEYKYTRTDYYGVDDNGFWWKVGALWCVAQAVCAVGLPYVLVVMPMHLRRRWSQRTGPDGAHLDVRAADSETEDGRWLAEELSGFVTPGRPDVLAVLEDVAARADCPTEGGVCVCAAGPELLMASTQLHAMRLRSLIRARVDFHRMAATL